MKQVKKMEMGSKILVSLALTGSLLMTGTIESTMNSNGIIVEAASSTTYQTTTALNMRKGAGTSYKVVTTLAKGTKITASSTKKVGSTTWYKATVKGKTGWVSGKYLKKVTVTTKKTTTNSSSSAVAAASGTYQTTASLNMRKGAGTNYGRVTTIPKSKQVKATQSKKVGSTTWYKVTYGKYSGWVSGKYLKKVTTTPTKVTKDKFNLTTGKFFTNIYSIKNPGNILVLANKNNKLSSSFVPSKLRTVNVTRKNSASTKMVDSAADALESMFAGAKKEGIKLGAFSGYRSYKDQQSAYNKYKDDNISARPGHSEHQTGLAMDVIAATNVSKDGSKVLVQSFGSSKEGKWLAANAHKYGFIIRYPKGKEKITGYSYEPWHVRYVGKDVAAKLYKEKWTLEEAYIKGYLK